MDYSTNLRPEDKALLDELDRLRVQLKENWAEALKQLEEVYREEKSRFRAQC